MSPPHIALFPFMSKGHTIPLLHLAARFRRRNVAVTIFTTIGNHSFISDFFSDDGVSIVDLPFPENVPGIPEGIESTDKLPSMSLFLPFVSSTQKMQCAFEEALEKIHSTVSCVISDCFLHWTQQSAAKFGVPRIEFSGMSFYVMFLIREIISTGVLWLHDSDDEPFSVAAFPAITLTRNHFNEPFSDRNPSGPHWDFIVQCSASTAASYGLLMNSFTELESPFMELYERGSQQKSFAVGPLVETRKPKTNPNAKPTWIQFLDEKLAQGQRVLYIAFGSQAKLSATQMTELALGLEQSNVNFLWVVKKSEAEILSGFEERVKERGIIVSEWVDQREILEHESVEGFVSHCGWSSVLEGICAAVPIIAWPLMADQFLNAKFVEEEIKVGLKLTIKEFVTADKVKNAVVELMDGEEGKKMRQRVKELADVAAKTTADGGAAWVALDKLIVETQNEKAMNCG